MEEIEKVEIIENKVEYQQPKFWHTVMAKFVDIFIFLLMGFILFSIIIIQYSLVQFQINKITLKGSSLKLLVNSRGKKNLANKLIISKRDF